MRLLWDEKMYSVDDAGPIGLSLMVVIAEGYLQCIESKAIQDSLTNYCTPKSYRRYVDDSHEHFDSSDAH